MPILQAVVLGIVQGITEFLPISSDGHLILVPSLLGWERFGLGFDVLLHLGTLIGTLIYFRKDFTALAVACVSLDGARAPQRRLAVLILAVTVVSGIVALGLEGFVEGVEDRAPEAQIAISAAGLLLTTLLLGGSELVARRSRSRRASEDPATLRAGALIVLGVAQGLAALPGVSRSGSTIASGQALGLSRESAARFSFLLSVPIVGVAVLKKTYDAAGTPGVFPDLATSLVGVAVTAVVSIGALSFLIPFVKRHSLGWFAAYTGTAGILLLVIYGKAVGL